MLYRSNNTGQWNVSLHIVLHIVALDPERVQPFHGAELFRIDIFLKYITSVSTFKKERVVMWPFFPY